MKNASKMILPALLATTLLGAGCGQAEPETQGMSGDTVAMQYAAGQGQPPANTKVDANAESGQAPAPTDAPAPTPAPTTPVTPTTMPEALAFPGVMDAQEVNKKVRIKTTLGDIVVQVDPDQGPNAASNFVYLVKKGFYNGTIFHRVIPGFMIQGGDPTGTGMSGPGYQFKNDPVKSPYSKGIVAMANAGRDTNGSQFFIMVDSVGLPPDYSVFGHVIEGQDVADKISMTPRNGNDRPNTEVKMISVTIE
jgi:cyclophilin family peptidyl-prolyl cis-trans isomerase